MSSILDRINILIATENLSASALAKKIDMPQNSVNYYLKGERKLSLEFVENILNAFPSVTSNWIMRGKGDMYAGPDPDTCDVAELEYYKSLAELRNARVRELENTIAKLQVALDRTIRALNADNKGEMRIPVTAPEEKKPMIDFFENEDTKKIYKDYAKYIESLNSLTVAPDLSTSKEFAIAIKELSKKIK